MPAILEPVVPEPVVTAPTVPTNVEVRIKDLLSAPNMKVYRGCIKFSETYVSKETNEATPKRYGAENSFRAVVYNALAAETACKELGIPIQEGHGAQEVVDTAIRRLGLNAEKAQEVLSGMDLRNPQLPQPENVADGMKKQQAVTAFLINVKGNLAPEVYGAKVPDNLKDLVTVQLKTLAVDREDNRPMAKRQVMTNAQKDARDIRQKAMAMRVELTTDTFTQWKSEAQALHQAKPELMSAEALDVRMKQLDAMQASFQNSYATRVPKLNINGDRTGVVLTGAECDNNLLKLAKACQETNKSLQEVQATVASTQVETKTLETEQATQETQTTETEQAAPASEEKKPRSRQSRSKPQVKEEGIEL